MVTVGESLCYCCNYAIKLFKKLVLQTYEYKCHYHLTKDILFSYHKLECLSACLLSIPYFNMGVLISFLNGTNEIIKFRQTSKDTTVKKTLNSLASVKRVQIT
jgi:hypothetical protein